MKSSLFLLMYLVVASAEISAESPASSWKKIGNRDGTTIFVKELPDSPLLAFKGQRLFKYPAEQLLWLIQEKAEWPHWLELFDKGHVMERKGYLHRRVYQLFGSPSFLISSRDVVVEVKAFRLPKDPSIYIESYSVKDERAPEAPGERSTLFYSRWVLTPQESGGALVSLEALTDPGGWIPNFIVNFVQEDYAANMFAKMQKRLKKIPKKTVALPPIEKDGFCFVCSY